MGGQGFIPEDGKGGLVEGQKESEARENLPDAAPRAGIQGRKERGSAPTQILPRPGTSPAGGRTNDVQRKTEQGAATQTDGTDLDTGE